MNKQELLSQITSLVSQKQLSKSELIEAYEKGLSEDDLFIRRLSISEVLYFLGGLIVFFGITVLVAQNWSTLGDFSKILITLGVGISSHFIGAIFSKEKKTELVGQAFFLISSLVMPIGFFVLFDVAGFSPGSSFSQSLNAVTMLAIQLLSYLLYKKVIFQLFSIAFGTWLFFSVAHLLIGNSPVFEDLEIYKYLFLVTGISYIFMGYHFSSGEKSALTSPLYGFGIMFFLGAALVLGGWEPKQNMFWELIFPGLSFGAIFLSVRLRSKSFLVFGILYLMLYLVKITTEYFSEGLGWPLALVLAGLMLIAIGYGGYYVNKRYFGTSVS